MKTKFCFIHIEKAGGSTIHNWFRYYLLSYISLHPWYFWSNETGNWLTKRELKVLKFFQPKMIGFGGHTTRHFLKYDKALNNDLIYFTFLRDPISRYLSHYQYQKEIMNLDIKFEDFINDKRYNNFMCKRITGTQNSTTAYNQLDQYFGFVGLIENFDECCLALTKKLGYSKLKPHYEKVNIANNSSKLKIDDLPIEIRDKIIENNKEDILLYNNVKDVLYPNQKVIKDISDFELNLFRQQLKSFRYKSVRRFFMKVIKAYNHFFSERIAHLFK